MHDDTTSKMLPLIESGSLEEKNPTATQEKKGDGVREYVSSLLVSKDFAGLVTCHRVVAQKEASFRLPSRPWTKAIADILEQSGIDALYTHQANAIDVIRSGRSVVVATPTASGKSLIYNLPVIERHLADPDAKSLFLFPLKALAQDQLQNFKELTAHWSESARPHAAVYDGDTTAHKRKKIRENLPSVLFTNPEMLHLAMLPHHHLWATLFAGLSFVVVDEVHTYRGILGAHMAQVFRRLKRIAALYGASPTFIFCSATVGNPVELTSQLTGESPVPVLESGAPQGKRHFLFINPEDSPASDAIKLLRSALSRGLRTIVYCQSRRMTELISLWASKNSQYASKISAYRAGYLPEERREIESQMASGELLAVISTSALELGIDIGNLDICILVGYPGTVMSTLQRGGRVGRSMQESAVILVAQEDALDQYIVRHPENFFSRQAETAILNPENPVILARHLECAAAELPLRLDRAQDAAWIQGGVLPTVRHLEQEGKLLRSADGFELIASQKNPQRHVALRGSGTTVAIVDEKSHIIGSVDAIRAMREAHPGAVYLHRGQYYEIQDLDIPAGKAHAKKQNPPWYTKPRSTKDTEILSIEKSTIIGGMAVQFGRLRVTDLVTGYERRAMQSGQLMGVVPLDFPPQVFETEGLWLLVPKLSQERIESAFMHFMGSIHALEHAAIGILPLLVMTDRNDLGGISKPMHLQTGKPTVFIYDGMPGGAGLSREAFIKVEEMFAYVENVIGDCPCDLGCPSCVHSPKCGSGNRPIDKVGALALLRDMLKEDSASIEEAKQAIASPLISPTDINRIASSAQQEPIAWATVLDNVHVAKEREASSLVIGENRGISSIMEESNTSACVNKAENERSRSEEAEYSQRKSSFSLHRSPSQEEQESIKNPILQRGFQKDDSVHSVEQDAVAAASMYAFIAEEGAVKPCGVPSHLYSVLHKAEKHSEFQNIHTRVIQEKPMVMTIKNSGFTGELPEHFAVLDVETRYSAKEVGGWHKSHRMGVSVAVVYDAKKDAYTSYLQDEIPQMAEDLQRVPLVIGFNTLRFDYAVLDAHAQGFSFHTLSSLDMLAEVYGQLSYRISLDNLATATLGAEKSADGLQALAWWKEKRLDLIEEYCKKDVQLTKDLFLFGRDKGYLLFNNKAGQKVRVRASWSPLSRLDSNEEI